jgi:hypothetical protein
MHDWDRAASNGFAAIFRWAEAVGVPAPMSKDGQMRRLQKVHGVRASTEGITS